MGPVILRGQVACTNPPCMNLKRHASVIIIAIAGASFFLVACGGQTHTMTSSASAVTGIHTHDSTFQGTK